MGSIDNLIKFFSMSSIAKIINDKSNIVYYRLIKYFDKYPFVIFSILSIFTLLMFGIDIQQHLLYNLDPFKSLYLNLDYLFSFQPGEPRIRFSKNLVKP